MEIEWAEPPSEVLFKHENRGGKYVEFAMGLMKEPGRWAKMPAESATTDKSRQGLAQSIRRGSIKGFTKGMYEAVLDNEAQIVYVRCKPESEWPSTASVPMRRDNGNGGGSGNGSDDDLPAVDEVDPKEVRAWARENGWPSLSERGRIGGEILTAYQTAHATTDDE